MSQWPCWQRVLWPRWLVLARSRAAGPACGWRTAPRRPASADAAKHRHGPAPHHGRGAKAKIGEAFCASVCSSGLTGIAAARRQREPHCRAGGVGPKDENNGPIARESAAQARRHLIHHQSRRRSKRRPKVRTHRSTRSSFRCRAFPTIRQSPIQIFTSATNTRTSNTGSTALYFRRASLVLGRCIDTNFVGSMSLLTGTLPAQYGLRTAGVLDITSRSFAAPAGDISIYGGSRGTFTPSVNYGGSTGDTQYFITARGNWNNLGHRKSNTSHQCDPR